MAAKKKTARKTRGRRQTLVEQKKLLAKAHAELESLLRDQEHGTLTQVHLRTQLQEIDRDVMDVIPFGAE
jgi:hypothetical protein